MKIAVITCYHDPDYVRARTLRAALQLIPRVKIAVVKNKHTGLLRYWEVLRVLRRVRKQQNPDAYLLTFRGQELLPFVLWIAGNKPVIFDELIVPIAYAQQERHVRSFRTSVFHFLARASQPLYRRWLNKTAAILADTTAHAELSARLGHMNLSKYTVVPVGTDEEAFQPMTGKRPAGNKFTVFYYSSGMQPLHGMQVVLLAAELLKDNEAIEFLIVGGKRPLQRAVQAAARRGAHIRYERWIPFADLLVAMHTAAVCLGGAFGNTSQAHHVITTKTYQMLAAGVPTIVGASEVSQEFFADKENALVVEQGSAQALASAIAWAYKHPEELEVMAQNGRILYEKQFSAVAIARILEPLVSRL